MYKKYIYKLYLKSITKHLNSKFTKVTDCIAHSVANYVLLVVDINTEYYPKIPIPTLVGMIVRIKNTQLSLRGTSSTRDIKCSG